MKRSICFLIFFAIVFGLIGCADRGEAMQEPKHRYYRTNPNEYKNTRKTIDCEVFDAAIYNDDLKLLLNDYLMGPQSENLINPFPDSCAVESIVFHEDEVHLALNSGFSKLTGIDLSLACACISLTLFELTDCKSVHIAVPDILLDGQHEIVLQRNDVILEYINR